MGTLLFLFAGATLRLIAICWDNAAASNRFPCPAGKTVDFKK
jgi:hypothetical protein